MDKKINLEDPVEDPELVRYVCCCKFPPDGIGCAGSEPVKESEEKDGD